MGFLFVLKKMYYICHKIGNMKKLMLLVVISMILLGCYGKPQSVERTGNGYQVEYLFEKDGVKVYRFFDGGAYHYFTSQGETITKQTKGEYIVDENIK